MAVELNQGATNQYLKAPLTSAGYTLGAVETSFTIQAWLKPTDCEGTTGTPTFVMKHYSFIIGCNSGTWHYILGTGSSWYGGGGSVGNWIDTSVTAEDDVWQHIALTRASSSSGVKLFVNGVQSYSVSSYEGDLGGNTANSLHVGTRQGYLTDDAWHGLIDDLRIYTSDRSSTIADDMNEYPSVNDANLNAFFDFNLERDGDTVSSVSNLATGTGASSASLTSVTGSPEVVRTWDVSTSGSDTILTFERTVLTAQGGWRVPRWCKLSRDSDCRWRWWRWLQHRWWRWRRCCRILQFSDSDLRFYCDRCCWTGWPRFYCLKFRWCERITFATRNYCCRRWRWRRCHLDILGR